jgi:hypothetical protein
MRESAEERALAQAEAVKALTQRVEASQLRGESGKYLAFNKGFHEFSKGSRSPRGNER